MELNRKPTIQEEGLIEILLQNSFLEIPKDWKEGLMVRPMDNGMGDSLYLFPKGKDIANRTFWKTDHLAQRAIDADPNQNLYFSTGSPEIFRSYKYLRFLGMINFGFGLDAILQEDAYPDKTMKKDVGLIYSYSQTLFTITMDFPDGEREKTDFTTTNNLSFIHGVDYGRRAFLVVESDGSGEVTKSLITKAMREENLSESERSLINSMDIHYLYFSPTIE